MNALWTSLADRALLLAERWVAVQERGATAAPPKKRRKPTGDAPACPTCTGAMTLRHRRADGAPFWGCASYPDCTGIENIGDDEDDDSDFGLDGAPF